MLLEEKRYDEFLEQVTGGAYQAQTGEWTYNFRVPLALCETLEIEFIAIEPDIQNKDSKKAKEFVKDVLGLYHANVKVRRTNFHWIWI